MSTTAEQAIQPRCVSRSPREEATPRRPVVQQKGRSRMPVSATVAKESDEALVVRFLEGEGIAFDELVRRHQQRVYRIAWRIVGNHDDADDVVQEVFVKVYRGLRKFRGESRFFTWLFRVATNTALGMQRRKKLLRVFSGYYGEGMETTGDLEVGAVTYSRDSNTHTMHLADDLAHLRVGGDVSEVMEAKEQRALIEEAIQKLPKKQRMVFILRFYEELPYQEISNILKTSVGGLKANYYHAFKKIAAYVWSKQ